MTWHDTFPDPTMYYHVPKKTLRPIGALADRVGAGASDLRLWTPHRRHEYGDPYLKQQRGHVSRVTLNVPTPDGYRSQYDVHQTKKGITATVDTSINVCTLLRPIYNIWLSRQAGATEGGGMKSALTFTLLISGCGRAGMTSQCSGTFTTSGELVPAQSTSNTT